MRTQRLLARFEYESLVLVQYGEDDDDTTEAVVEYMITCQYDQCKQVSIELVYDQLKYIMCTQYLAVSSASYSYLSTA